MVGLAGLEPATFRPPDGRATRLRYSPTAPVHTVFRCEGKLEISIILKLHFDHLARLMVSGGASAIAERLEPRHQRRDLVRNAPKGDRIGRGEKGC
jgi:hypothetical protein